MSQIIQNLITPALTIVALITAVLVAYKTWLDVQLSHIKLQTEFRGIQDINIKNKIFNKPNLAILMRLMWICISLLFLLTVLFAVVSPVTKFSFLLISLSFSVVFTGALYILLSKWIFKLFEAKNSSLQLIDMQNKVIEKMSKSLFCIPSKQKKQTDADNHKPDH